MNNMNPNTSLIKSEYDRVVLNYIMNKRDLTSFDLSLKETYIEKSLREYERERITESLKEYIVMKYPNIHHRKILSLLSIKLIPLFQSIFSTRISPMVSFELFYNITILYNLSYDDYKNGNEFEIIQHVLHNPNFMLYLNIIYDLVNSGSTLTLDFSKACYDHREELNDAIEYASRFGVSIESVILQAIRNMGRSFSYILIILNLEVASARTISYIVPRIPGAMILDDDYPIVNLMSYRDLEDEYEISQDYPIVNLIPYQNLIKSIKNTPFINIDSTCVICLYNIGETGYTSKCNHVFHRDCIVDYVEKSQFDNIRETCPMCRQKL